MRVMVLLLCSLDLLLKAESLCRLIDCEIMRALYQSTLKDSSSLICLFFLLFFACLSAPFVFNPFLFLFLFFKYNLIMSNIRLCLSILTFPLCLSHEVHVFYAIMTNITHWVEQQREISKSQNKGRGQWMIWDRSWSDTARSSLLQNEF